MSEDKESLHKIRSEVNELKFRQGATDSVIVELKDAIKTLTTSFSTMDRDFNKALNKLDKKFTIFIIALVMSVGFGDGITEVLLRLLF